MLFGKTATGAAIRLLKSSRAQRFLDRVASHVDLWRGYGAGVYVESSGEAVLFDILRDLKLHDARPVIFDVGANLGEFAGASLNALGPDIEIHAFEPAKEVFARLSRRFAGHNLITLNNIALGREAGTRALFGFPRDIGMASLLKRQLADGEHAQFQENVTVLRLSDYCKSVGIERVNLLKMDVEGYEMEVLTGAALLFSNRQIDICSFEFGGCNLDSRTYLRDFFEFFHKYDMDVYRITPGATLVPLPRYHEQLEKFTTTNYVALRR